MARVRKDLQVLGFEVEELDNRNFVETNDYHKYCLPQEEDWQGRITSCITKETLEKDANHKFICDRCGEEIT